MCASKAIGISAKSAYETIVTYTVSQTRSSAIADRPRDCACLYSFSSTIPQSVIRPTSTSELPMHTNKFCSVLFGMPVD